MGAGRPRAFYRGLLPSLQGMIPYAGIDLAAYETLKDLSRKYILKDSEPGPPVQLGCGTISGALGATCVYPCRLLEQGISIDMADYRVYDDDKEDIDLAGDMNVSIITTVLFLQHTKYMLHYFFAILHGLNKNWTREGYYQSLTLDTQFGLSNHLELSSRDKSFRPMNGRPVRLCNRYVLILYLRGTFSVDVPGLNSKSF